MADVATNVPGLTLSTTLKRTHSDLQFTWPAGEDFSFAPDEIINTTWTPEIGAKSSGVLYLFKYGDKGMNNIVISDVPESNAATGSLTGTSCRWFVPSKLMEIDDFFVEGGVYWLYLEVYPDEIAAASVDLALHAPNDDSESTPTTSASQVPTPKSAAAGQGSTAIVSITSIVYQTTTPVDVSQPTGLRPDHYRGASYSAAQTLSPTAKVGIAIGGGLLGISLLVLLGVFLYRRRRSSAKYHEPSEGQDTAVETVPEQQANTGIRDTATLSPKEHIGVGKGGGGLSSETGNLHEME